MELNKEYFENLVALLENKIQVCLDNDIPYDQLQEELNAAREQLKQFDEPIKEEAQKEEAVEDAPFRRVLMLVEINKDDEQDAIDYINRFSDCRYYLYDIR